MPKKLGVAEASPYDLFKKDDHQINLFLKHCRTCKFDVLDIHVKQCPIIEILTNSIVDRSVRWDEKWISMESGIPVCTQYKEKEK
jgi:hypothetical protein